jgi:hypothetical protein
VTDEFFSPIAPASRKRAKPAQREAGKQRRYLARISAEKVVPWGAKKQRAPTDKKRKPGAATKFIEFSLSSASILLPKRKRGKKEIGRRVCLKREMSPSPGIEKITMNISVHS